MVDKRHLKGLAALALLAAALAGTLLFREHLSSVEEIGAHKRELLDFIRMHYLEAVFSFIALYLGTGLFLPGAMVLSVAGGLMFGTLPAALYLNVGATLGAALAFLGARYFLKDWIQERFKNQLSRFNHEMERHGPNYLLVLRMLPVLPFFVVNYGAGISRVRFRTFVWTTSLGILPGSLIHTYIGHQLRQVNAPNELFSWKIFGALALISLAALFPVIRHHLQARKR